MSFEAFYNIAANFLEDDDDEAMQNELKEAFRLYDKEGTYSYSKIPCQIEYKTIVFIYR